jgi:hypothetical protein
MTRILFTLPGSEPHAAATQQHYEPRQTRELRRIKVGMGIGHAAKASWLGRFAEDLCSSALHFGSATI